jgi:3-oxoacyl-[acyl-carrier-protein] synthase-3
MQLRQGPSATRILGLGSYQPDRVVTNDELAQLMDTNDEWIRDRVGIIERRFADKTETVADMGVEAGSKAVADAGLSAPDVDTVIVATCTMPSPIPNAAAQIADRIGIKAVGAFDVNAACAGFCYAVGMASDLVRAGTANNVLVIGSEKLTDVVDPVDRSTAIIFADGAGAAVVGPSEEPGIGPVAWGSAGDMADTIIVPDRLSYLQQEGQAVFRWATTALAPVARQACALAGVGPTELAAFVPHQANLRIVEAIARKLKAVNAVVADDIVEAGNTSAASIPMALSRMIERGDVPSGAPALLIGFGAGICYAAQVITVP